MVERGNGYLETSFLPGRMFTSPNDFNTQLTGWLQIANRRVHRTLDARPAERWEADRTAMMPLPPTAPPRWWQTSVRIGRDHYIRLDTCDYSVHPDAIGRIVRIEADTETVRAHLDGRLVADHARCWARHQTLTDPAHAEAAQVMRRRHHRLAAVAAAAVEVAPPDLPAYDRVFQLIEGGAGQEE
jgi:transposase